MKNVLFVCTHNSARSVLAECLMTRHGKLAEVALQGHSAGSTPRGQVNPMAITFLQAQGYDTSQLTSKSWDVFGGAGAPVMDVIITVCDDAAGESCPFWPGHPATAHWGIADPSRQDGDEDARFAAFGVAYGKLEKRIAALAALPLDTLGPTELRAHLQRIHVEAADGTGLVG